MTLDVGQPGFPSRPHSAANCYERLQRPPFEPPPCPSLPPNFQFHNQNMYRPQSAAPLFAPQPQQPIRDLRPVIPHTLDETFGVSYNGPARFAPPPPPPVAPLLAASRQEIQGHMVNHVPTFPPSDLISYRGPSRALPRPPPPFVPPLPPAGATWDTQPRADIHSVTSLMASASLTGPQMSRIQSVHGVMEYSRPAPPPFVSVPRPLARPPLAAPLPSISTLQDALPSIQSPNVNDSSRVSWIRDVLLLVKRASAAEGDYVSSSALPLLSNALPAGPIRISNTDLRNLAESAVTLLISVMPTLPDRDQELSPALAEALYIRAILTTSGAFPHLIAASPRNAFREFERAARAGFSHAWFCLGRDYEGVDDVVHARQCFEKGVAGSDPGCIYRMGMASLLGQLNCPPDSVEGLERAARLLHQAAKLATVDFPHPPYVFALFLLGEFEKVSIPASVLATYITPGSNSLQEARLHLERAAFLQFAPAQQRIGRAYEFAEPPFPFDPLMSVEYYSLASAGGDAQADLALSKWYLCGAEGYLTKDETRAREHAARAAARGIPAAMFAMGYCCEVGIGAPTNIDHARQWYEDAASRGDLEAQGRLKALADTLIPLSREQHETLAETRLVRSRTLARVRSDATNLGDVPLSNQSTVHQQHGGYQRRQSSLPSHMPPPDQYGTPHPAFQRRGLPQHSASLPPPRTTSRLDNTTCGPPYAVPQAQSQQRFTDRARYSLVDPGVVHQPDDTTSPSLYGNGGLRHSTLTGAALPRVGRHKTGASSISSLQTPRGSPRSSDLALPPESASVTTTSGTRYNTFEEMGIQGARAEDKECVIM